MQALSDEDEQIACQECSKQKATIHLTDFVDGKPVQMHLCEECYAAQKGLPPLSQSKLFAQLISAIAPDLQKVTDEECPNCGISYMEFRQTLRMGCPEDYEVFEEPLQELLLRLHGAEQHVGKIPVGRAQKGTRQVRLDALQRELTEVVSREDFEEAARIRDEVKKLEKNGVASAEE